MFMKSFVMLSDFEVYIASPMVVLPNRRKILRQGSAMVFKGFDLRALRRFDIT